METQISDTHVVELTNSVAATGGTTIVFFVTTTRMAVRSLITIIEGINGILSHLQPKIKIN